MSNFLWLFYISNYYVHHAAASSFHKYWLGDQSLGGPIFTQVIKIDSPENRWIYLINSIIFLVSFFINGRWVVTEEIHVLGNWSSPLREKSSKRWLFLRIRLGFLVFLWAESGIDFPSLENRPIKEKTPCFFFNQRIYGFSWVFSWKPEKNTNPLKKKTAFGWKTSWFFTKNNFFFMFSWKISWFFIYLGFWPLGQNLK